MRTTNKQNKSYHPLANLLSAASYTKEFMDELDEVLALPTPQKEQAFIKLCLTHRRTPVIAKRPSRETHLQAH